MAKAPKTAPAYEPAATYDVRITKVASVNNLRLLPKNRHTMTGAILNQLVAEHGADLVDAAVKIEWSSDAG